MEIKRPQSFLRETEHYWVLGEFTPSKPPLHDPDKKWEIRTSKRDGKTYCSCPAWVIALNRARRNGTKGEVCCKHLVRFKADYHAPDDVIIMDADGFELLKRNMAMIPGVRFGDSDVIVKRNQ